MLASLVRRRQVGGLLLQAQRSVRVCGPGSRRLLSTTGDCRADIVEVNGRSYNLDGAAAGGAARAVVGICVDGSAQEYIDEAIKAGAMPRLQGLLQQPSQSAAGLVETVVPTYTNPNNVAIVTGVPPKTNGICGNYLLDPATRQEVMMNEPRFLRCPTLFAGLAARGAEITVVTAKDKLLKLLGHGLDAHPSFCGFSVEKALEPQTTAALQRRGVDSFRHLMDLAPDAPVSGIYDPDISIDCIAAGHRLLARTQGGGSTSPSSSSPSPPPPPPPPVRVFYLSTTDYVQHKHAPGDAGAIEFYGKLDRQIGLLHDAGAVVGITADHGMNAKVQADGSPKVLFLESDLAAAGIPSRVILPITDPYVVHHGALGGYATIYLDNPAQVPECLAHLRQLPGVDVALDAAHACAAYDLPPDRIGDVVVMGDQHTVLGRTEAWHDLSNVPNLRSHGALYERTVPMIINRPLKPAYAAALAAGRLRNYDLFDILFNGVVCD